MRARPRVWLIPVLAFVMVAATAAYLMKRPPARAVTFEQKTAGADLVDKPGARPPRELRFTNQAGQSVTLGDYLGGKPTVLVLAYYKCPMLCSMVLNGVLDAVKTVKHELGADFRIVTVSFDPRDDVAAARAKREVYLGALGKDVGDRGWDFLVGDEATVRRLADSVGFGYRWDPDLKEYAHNAGIFVLSPEGQVARTIYGIKFEDKLGLALAEASEGRLGSAWDRMILFCYNWDPHANSYALAGRRLMQGGGVLMVVSFAAVLIWLWRRDRLARPIKEHPAT